MDQRAKNIYSLLAVLIIIYGTVANYYKIWPFGVSNQGLGTSNQEGG